MPLFICPACEQGIRYFGSWENNEDPFVICRNRWCRKQIRRVNDKRPTAFDDDQSPLQEVLIKVLEDNRS